MSDSFTAAHTFQQSLLSLRWLHRPTEFYQRLRHDMPLTLQSLQTTLNKYKTAARNMPKAIRCHPLVKKSLGDIKSLEADFRRFRKHMKDNSSHEFEEWCDNVGKKLTRASVALTELETSPFMQMILRGEAILPGKATLQWRRKIGHACSGLFFLFFVVYSGLPKVVIWGGVGIFVLCALALETARHLNPRVNAWVLRIFGPVMRDREREQINSAIFYIVAMFIVYIAFPLEVAILVMLFIAVGDPIAGIVGSLWGRTRISSHVSLEGSLACFVTCTALSLLAAAKLFSHTLSGAPLMGFSVLSGLVGTAAEASFKKLDDNLVMPLVSAPFLWLLMKGFGTL